jgi:MinD superfamily P-loop ATPase
MKIAVASGKGGTGKTTVAVALAHAAVRTGAKAVFVDCDCEEPDGHIFLKPLIESNEPVYRPVPDLDESNCSNCGLCGEICRYSAILCATDQVMTFPELCHSCGGCRLVCPAGAISDRQREIGIIEKGKSGDIRFIHGILNVGEPMSPPLIRQVRKNAPNSGIQIIDTPPGTSCPAIEAVRGVDYVIVVTEPTPFGLNDLRLAIGMIRAMGLPCGVVINRSGSGDGGVEKYCHSSLIRILAEIPEERDIAEAYSRGEIISGLSKDLCAQFDGLLKATMSRI